MNKSLFLSALVFSGLLILDAGAQLSSYPPKPEAIAALSPVPGVSVTSFRDQVYTFRPTGSAPTKGVVLYPGGLVDFRSYSLLARDIAAEGYAAVIVKMPMDIPILGYKRALLGLHVNRDIRTWAIGGHSLGGVASCTFAREFRGIASGVILLASYPSSNDSLRFSKQRVVSIYGTRDGLTDASDIKSLHQPASGRNEICSD